VRWVAEYAAEIGADPRPARGRGGSAGGNLAAAAALRAESLAGLPPALVITVRYDPRAIRARRTPASPRTKLTGRAHPLSGHGAWVFKMTGTVDACRGGDRAGCVPAAMV
jgi:hypothetical protein